MAGKDRLGNEFKEGIYLDMRNGIAYSFKKGEEDSCFGPAWLGSPLEIGNRRGVLLSDGDALIKNFAPIFVKKGHDEDIAESL